MEQKHNRPYIQMYIEIDGVQYAAPLRSGIQHYNILKKKLACKTYN